MRWIATAESVEKGEPSVLAIVETLVAMALSVWVSFHFSTVRNIVTAASIAPFLLLRTTKSDLLGAVMWRHLAPDEPRSRGATGLGGLVEALGCCGAMLFIRTAAVLRTTWRYPALGIRSVPTNWKRATLALDFSRPPTVVPWPDRLSEREIGASLYLPDLYVLVRNLVRVTREALGLRPVDATAVILWVLAAAPYLCLPPLLYRIALKSTAIIWFPLLWAQQALAPGRTPLKARLALFEQSDLLRWIILPVSAASISGFIAKLGLWNSLARAAATWNETILGRIATIHVAPGVIEWWQVATVLNSLIAFGLWLYVRSCIRHIDLGVPKPEKRVENVLGWTLFVRRLLTSYTVLCIGYLYVREMGTWTLPPLGGKPFPWM